MIDECKRLSYLEDLSLIFILHWNIYLAKRGEPERMLGSHKELLEGG
jgi:hypothetical protein